MARPHPLLLAIARGQPLTEPDDPAALVASANEHRMTGMLWSRISASELALDELNRARLMQRQVIQRAHHRRVWGALEAVAARMAPLGVQLATFKGPTAAARWYDEEGQRPFGDLDLLVGPNDHRHAEAIVRALDPDHELLAVVQRFVDSRALPSIDLELDGVAIDLHFDLLKFEVPSRRLELFWSRTLPYPLPGGTTIRVLDPEASLVQFLIHVNRDRFRHLMGHIDVARVIEREQLDWDAVFMLMRSEGLEVPLTLTLEAVAEVMQLDLPLHPKPRGWRAWVWRRLWSPGVRLRGDVAHYKYRNRHRALPFLARGRFGDAVRDWMRYLAPPRELMDVHFPETSGPYWKRNIEGRLRHVLARRRASARLRPDGSPVPSRGTGPSSEDA